MLVLLVPLLKELIFFFSMCTQGSISGFALISPWALQEYRAYGTHKAEERNPLFLVNKHDVLTKISAHTYIDLAVVVEEPQRGDTPA